MLQFTVNPDRCTHCGECAADCPSQIIRQAGDALPAIPPESEAACIQCQHCLAICPTAAISIFGRNPDDSIPLDKTSFPALDSMERLVRGRRSIRRYRDEDVDPALIQRLLTAVANAPSGVNARRKTFVVIDRREIMHRFREQALNDLAAAVRDNKVPARFGYLHQAVPLWFDNQVDVIFRGAPHLLIVAANPLTACPDEDTVLALAYFELLARTAGVGATWCGIIKMLLETIPPLKQALGIPHRARYYPMLFGYPAARYPRAVQRDDGAQVHRVTL